jgi:hypothetical protein
MNEHDDGRGRTARMDAKAETTVPCWDFSGAPPRDDVPYYFYMLSGISGSQPRRTRGGRKMRNEPNPGCGCHRGRVRQTDPIPADPANGASALWERGYDSSGRKDGSNKQSQSGLAGRGSRGVRRETNPMRWRGRGSGGIGVKSSLFIVLRRRSQPRASRRGGRGGSGE